MGEGLNFLILNKTISFKCQSMQTPITCIIMLLSLKKNFTGHALYFSDFVKSLRYIPILSFAIINYMYVFYNRIWLLSKSGFFISVTVRVDRDCTRVWILQS